MYSNMLVLQDIFLIILETSNNLFFVAAIALEDSLLVVASVYLRFSGNGGMRLEELNIKASHFSTKKIQSNTHQFF